MINKNPTVSVIIPTYNYADYLPEAIESVLKQTFRDIEVILVDDGSTDNTPQIVQKYLTNPLVHYVRKENGGQASAKNRGIIESTGEFIAFLDADDIWFSNKLELQLQLFGKNPHTGVVYSRRIYIDPSGKPLPTIQRKLHRGSILNKIYITNFVCFSSSIVRKNCFQRLGLFDEKLRFSEDYDFWIRVASLYDFDFVDSPLVYYRTGHTSTQQSRDKEQVYAIILGIMRRYASRPNSGVSIFSRLYAFSDTHKNMAFYYRGYKPFKKVLQTYVTSILYFPLNIWAWLFLIHYILEYISSKGLKICKWRT
jgi:glycosyltransferase involved in cell wall biosynthesis